MAIILLRLNKVTPSLNFKISLQTFIRRAANNPLRFLMSLSRRGILLLGFQLFINLCSWKPTQIRSKYWLLASVNARKVFSQDVRRGACVANSYVTIFIRAQSLCLNGNIHHPSIS